MNSNSDFLTLARLATKGRRQDVIAFLRRIAARSGKGTAETSALIAEMLENEESSTMRFVSAPPVDLESRSELLRVMHPKQQPKPILSDEADEMLAQVIRERTNVKRLLTAGLLPTRSVLLTGPPGVGKSMSAKWLASELGMPLMVLDLSAVMSSLLGKTGGNLRAVIDFAKGEEGILFLDEFDAIAKRRDDAIDIGELKRLVTVLLQEIDSWPHERLLLAATNHEDLLDPAVWRRFDLHLRFNLPDERQIAISLERLLEFHPDGKQMAIYAASAFVGRSFCDVERDITRIRKHSLLTGADFGMLLRTSVHGYCLSLRPRERKRIAVSMCKAGATQTVAHEWTGAARDTIRTGLEEREHTNG